MTTSPRCPTPSTRWHPLAQSGRGVGNAEPAQFAIGVEPVSVLIGDTASGQDAVGISDQRDRRRSADQCQPVVGWKIRPCRPRDTGVDLTDHGDSVLVQAEQPRHHQRQDDAGERSGHTRSGPLEHEDQHERADTHRR